MSLAVLEHCVNILLGFLTKLLYHFLVTLNLQFTSEEVPIFVPNPEKMLLTYLPE